MGLDRSRLPDPIEYFEAECPKLMGRGVWRNMACAFCGSGHAMRVNTVSGGWCCMACGAKGGDVLAYQMARYGMGFIEAARELGALEEDGKAEHERAPRALSYRDRVEVLRGEIGVAAQIIAAVHRRRAISETEFERFWLAAQRIGNVCEETKR